MFISAHRYEQDMNASICLYLFISSISVHICPYVCICSYVCICRYPSISVHICVYVYICRYVYICLYTFISVHMCISVHMIVSVNMVNRFPDQPRINPYVSISVHIQSIYTHICVYQTYISTYMLISVYICAYLFIFKTGVNICPYVYICLYRPYLSISVYMSISVNMFIFVYISSYLFKCVYRFI